MRILGIDPGTAITGYGVVEARRDGKLASRLHGAILTPSSWSLSARLQHIAQELRLLLREESPDLLSVEQLFFNRNARTALSVGHARGVVLLTGAEAGIPLIEFTPAQVKIAVTGNGRATKAQVQSMVQYILGLSETPKPDDVADALAVSICAHHSQGMLSKVARR